MKRDTGLSYEANVGIFSVFILYFLSSLAIPVCVRAGRAEAVELMCTSHYLTAERIQKSLCWQIVAWASSHLPVTAAPAVASGAGWKASKFQETTFLSVWKSVFRACREKQSAQLFILTPEISGDLIKYLKVWTETGILVVQVILKGFGRGGLFWDVLSSLHVHSSMWYNLKRADSWMRISPGTKEEKIDILHLTLSVVVI